MYTSATLSLAVLEILVHTEATNLPDDYIALSAEIPDASITTVGMSELPADWRETRDQESLQSIGKAWVDLGETALLSVPSAIVPDERNYLINPAHRDMSRIRIGRAQMFGFDPRLVGLRDRR